jgi:uncharacterized protein
MVHTMALGTILLFGGVGLLLIHFVQGRDPWPLLTGPQSLWVQLPAGTLIGTAMGFFAWWLVKRPFMEPVLDLYAQRIGPLLAHRSDRILISICAGVGEELFFRGALQHWLGLVLTAVLFVAIHGYLDPRNWRISIYGTAMTVLMVGLGWMADHMGLVAPMAAHTMIDVVLLEGLHSAWRKRSGVSLSPG